MLINSLIRKCLLSGGLFCFSGFIHASEDQILTQEVVSCKRKYSTEINQEENDEEGAKRRKLEDATGAVFAAQTTAEDLTSLSYCKNLRLLDVEHAPLTHNYREILTFDNLRTLEEVNFSHKHLTDKDLESFSKWAPSLRKLDLSYTDVKGCGLSYLVQLLNLQELSLYGSNIRDVDGLNFLLEKNNNINIFLRKARLRVKPSRIVEKQRVHILEKRKIKPAPLYTDFFIEK